MKLFSFEAIGTHWEIDIKEELSEERESSLYKKVQDRIEIFDKDYSRFRDDSLVTQISKNSGTYEMPEDFEEMISFYKKAYDITGGLITPLVGDVLVSAGYDSKYSLVKGEMKEALNWEECISWTKPNLVVYKPAVLDFGACGKGYLVDIISKIIESEGVKSYLVDGSGDMRHRGEDIIKIGLEHPEDKESVIGIVSIKNQSLCGSSGNRRKWADMHHIINPKTLTSPKDIVSVWVVSSSTILSDILTTCLFFVSPEEISKHFNFEYLILRHDYTVKKSDGFNAEIYS